MKAKDLKNSILQMAVQGKLVPQDPNEEPASVLIERIREDRRKLVAEGKAKVPKGGESVIYHDSDGSYYEKRGKSEPVCIDGEIPFEIPESWEWCRLHTLGWFGGGKTPSTSNKRFYAENGVLWVTSKDMKTDVITTTGISLSEEGAALLDTYPAGSVVMVTRSGILRRYLPVATLGMQATVNQDQKVIVPFDMSTSQWIATVFRAFDLYIRNELGKAGTTVESVNFDQVKEMLLPLPPACEQERIAARLGNLILLTSEYGNLEDERELLDTELPDRLRKAILQQAVQGKLVLQDPNDEPASVLLERIREERRKLVAEGKAKDLKGGESVIYRDSDGSYYEKCGKSEPVCIDEEIPFEIPESWEYARVRTLGSVVGGGTPKTSSPEFWANEVEGIPWITPADMKHVNGYYVSHGDRYVSQMGLENSSAQLLPAGSVVMSSRAPIGYLAISENDITTNQGFKSVVPYITKHNRWILMALDAQMDSIKARGTGTTFKEISGTSFGHIVVPLSPEGEQERILAKVDELKNATSLT